MAAPVSSRRPTSPLRATIPHVPDIPAGARMADLWYYGRGADVFGPFSGWEVADLADAGAVLPTDTVWEDGAEDGVPAGTIPHLFPAAAKPEAVPEAAPAVVRRARAVGGPGVSVSGQDGVTCRYRMKCPACGQEERSSNRITITRGTTRVKFFCPKCRKLRTGEINGYVS
jgi:hypothetical protein